ncbi:MAG: hypothetical protein ACT4NY_04345 [Pseudonocardiales bacterium]
MAPSARKVSLTGIKPTGEPHLGNFIGAIRPALELAQQYEAMYFIAGKGLMNRAHAYKAARDKNSQAGKDDLDAGINMGLYNYPVLMAADIILMDTGRTLPGIDGRKMSKSYGNTIPLFVSEPQLKKLVRRIPTDSTPVEDPKDPDSSSAFQILEQFASADVVTDTRKRLEAGGMGWGELKKLLFDVLNAQLGPLRARYEALMEPSSELDDVLTAGAEKARARARGLLTRVREATGIQ